MEDREYSDAFGAALPSDGAAVSRPQNAEPERDEYVPDETSGDVKYESAVNGRERDI